MPKLLRRFWFVLLIPMLAQAAPIKYEEGVHYRVLKTPVQTTTKADEIEVVEVFWYGCPHCYHLEPIVDRWKPSLPDDAKFVWVPGFFGPNIWQTHAQLHFAVASMITDKKKLHEVHDAIFVEIQERNNRLASVEAMAEFLNKDFGLDKKKFTSIYNSFGVRNLMNQASSKVRGYQLTGVPAMVVDGRYVVEPKVGLENMPVVTDYLIKKVRDDRAAAAKVKAAN